MKKNTSNTVFPSPQGVCLVYPLQGLSTRKHLSRISHPISGSEVSYLQHDHRISTNDYGANVVLFTAVALLDRIVQNNIQEYIVAAKDADDFARAVELHEEALVEVLFEKELC